MDNSKQDKKVAKQMPEGYQTLVEAAPFGIIMGDAEGEIYYVNSQFTELTGYTSQDIPDRETWFEKAYPEPAYRAEAKENWQKYIENSEADVKTEYWVTCRDGTEKLIKFKVNNLANNNIILTLEDITEKRKAEQALRASENKLDSIIQAVGVPLNLLNDNFEILWANQVAKDIFGKQIVGNKCYRTFLDRSENCEVCSAERTFADGKEHSHEARVVTNSGEEKVFSCTYRVAQYDAEGNPRTALGVWQDKTEEKEREKALKLFRTLMDGTQEGVFIIEPETGRILDVNEAVCRRLGYSRSEILEKYAWEISGYFDDKAAYTEKKHTVKETSGTTIETEHEGADGTSCPVEVTISDVTVEATDYRIVVARDISEHKKTQQKLRQKSQEMEQFAYAASHDLRKPLNQLFAFCDFLDRDLNNDDPEKAREDLEHLRETADDMDTLITELLALSRANTQELTREKVELDRCIQKVIQLFEDEIDRREATVKKDVFPTIYGDPTLLKQVFKNLLENSLKHSDNAPVIEIQGEELEEEVRIQVEDNGPGLPEGKTEQVFNPMYRGPETDTEGTGLGLAICDRIVDRHGGEIHAENIADRGARFEISLPIEGE